MSTAESQQIDAPEVEEVLRWRFEVLVRAGYDAGNAMILASHASVDLHKATDLLSSGCPPETALRIVL
jgi:ketol-acid reductoisomerase